MTIQEQFDECYAIENDQKALDCLKDMVKTATGNCRPKLVLLTQENCIPCRQEKARHAVDIKSGVIQEVDFNSAEGITIAEKNELRSIPALLFLDCRNNLIYPSV